MWAMDCGSVPPVQWQIRTTELTNSSDRSIESYFYYILEKMLMLVLNLIGNDMEIYKYPKRGNAPLGSGAPARKLTLWLYSSTDLLKSQYFCVILFDFCQNYAIFWWFCVRKCDSYHEIGVLLHCCNCRLHLLKHLLPKNPLCADSGDGCADSSMRCFEASISVFLLRASRPQRINTRWSEFWLRYSMMCLVNSSQPWLRWLPARCASTVSVLLSRSTPCLAQRVRSPEFGIGVPTSSWISLKMLRRDGGIVMPALTEKASPLAWPGPWYGSWPIITTLTLLISQEKAENTCSRGG